MSNDVSDVVFDDHEAPSGAAEESGRHSRAALVKRAAVAGGTLVGGSMLISGAPTFAAAAPSPKQDARIFNFLLELEELQNAFYAEARRRGALTGELSQFARIVGAHERRHVAYLRTTLGPRAQPRRTQSDFGTATSDPDEFVAAATALEDAVVAAFNGQGPNLTRSGLAAAARILSVEARHAAWIRAVADQIPAPVPNDPATTQKQAVRTLARTGFATGGRRR
jgi:hypothetical protein